MREDFAVFDSFDGARFFIKGSKVFKRSNNSNSPRSISKQSLKQNKQISNLNYFSQEEKASGLFASVFGQAEFVQGSSSFWNEKAGLFRGMSLISDEEIRQLEWNFNFANSMSLRTFTRTLSNDNSLYGSGLSFVYDSEDNIKRGFISFSRNTPNLELNLFDGSDVSSETTTLEFGGEYKISDMVSVFLGLTRTDIQDISSNYDNFGLTNAKTNGITTGINFKSNKNNFIIGFSKPEELNEGELSMLSPVGRNSNGDIIWKNKSFKLKQENYIPAILGWSHKINKNLNFDASIQESRYDNGELGSAQLSLNFVF